MGSMLFFMRLALVNCAFYLVGVFLLGAAGWGVSLWRGHFGLDATRTGWTLLFGIIWLVSFQFAWHVVVLGFLHSHKP